MLIFFQLLPILASFLEYSHSLHLLDNSFEYLSIKSAIHSCLPHAHTHTYILHTFLLHILAILAILTFKPYVVRTNEQLLDHF